ncbi:MAG: PadR family transcriptional regulator [Phycisphaerae bacterium]|nr:PadR family transcriptional regulator [Phycisphaerae bacterium]
MVSKELVAASGAPLILSILSRGESYGYAIIQEVRGLSGGRMQWTDGMLYPVLHRLEEQGLIRSRWGISETGRKRRYYRLRSEGGRALKDMMNQWQVVFSTLMKASEGEPCAT